MDRWLDSIAGVLAWARLHVGEGPIVRLDGLTDALGVQVIAAELSSSLWGLTLDENTVVVHNSISGPNYRHTVAHELAHVMVRRGRIRCQPSDEEWVADWFARELLLPLRRLVAFQTLAGAGQLGVRAGVPEGLMEAARSFHVPDSTAILQGMRLGALESPIVHGIVVLCRLCGDRRHVRGCECAVVARPRIEEAETPGNHAAAATFAC